VKSKLEYKIIIILSKLPYQTCTISEEKDEKSENPCYVLVITLVRTVLPRFLRKPSCLGLLKDFSTKKNSETIRLSFTGPSCLGLLKDFSTKKNSETIRLSFTGPSCLGLLKDFSTKKNSETIRLSFTGPVFMVPLHKEHTSASYAHSYWAI